MSKGNHNGKANQRAFDLQRQIRANAEDLRSFRQELDAWESSAHETDALLRNKKLVLTKKPPTAVRGSSGDQLRMEQSIQAKREFDQQKEAGVKHFRAGELQDAMECFSACLELQPDNVVVLCNRAMTQLRLGKYRPAAKDANDALKVDPRHVKALYIRAQCRFRTQDLDRALFDCRGVLKIDSTHIGARKLRDSLRTLISKRGSKGESKTDNVAPSEGMVLKSQATVPAPTEETPDVPTIQRTKIVIEESSSDEED